MVDMATRKALHAKAQANLPTRSLDWGGSLTQILSAFGAVLLIAAALGGVLALLL